jgi:transposase
MKKQIKNTKTESAKKQPVKTRTKSNSTEANNVSKEIRQLAKQLSHSLLEQANNSQAVAAAIADSFCVGIDLGDKKSDYCFLDAKGNIVTEGTLATTQAELAALFSAIPKCTIAIEVGMHSPWVNALLEAHGHEVFVANPRKMESIHKNRRKNDKVDARTLARLVRADPELLYPIRHRGVEARHDLVLLRARDGLVAARTKLINCVRGQVKSVGGRLPKCSAESFHITVADKLPDSVRNALLPLVLQIGEMTARIRTYDAGVNRMIKQKYPETECLQQVGGVGPITSLTCLWRIAICANLRHNPLRLLFLATMLRCATSSSFLSMLSLRFRDSVGRAVSVPWSPSPFSSSNNS